MFIVHQGRFRVQNIRNREYMLVCGHWEAVLALVHLQNWVKISQQQPHRPILEAENFFFVVVKSFWKLERLSREMASTCEIYHHNLEKLCEYLFSCVLCLWESLACFRVALCRGRKNDWFPLRPINSKHDVSSSDGDVGNVCTEISQDAG